MKVYFSASLSEEKKLKSNYQNIVKIIRSLGYQVDTLFLEINEKQTSEKKNKTYHELLKKLKSADIMVAEVSEPSLNLGYEISMALETNKPVLVLFSQGKTIELLEVVDNKNMIVATYNSNNLQKVLKEKMAIIKGMVDVRFNFFVSREILNYLDWLSYKRRIPRSVYLRETLEKEMHKDKEYQKIR